MHGRSIAVGDNDVVVVLGALQLVVGIDRVGLRRAVETALGCVAVRVRDRGAKVVDVEAIGGERARVTLQLDIDPN